MKNLPTRILLTCAAIGVAGGILLLPILGLFSAAVVAAAPLAYAALTGTWFFAGVLIQSITHRPGVAVITTFVAGLVTAPFTPYGFSAVASTVMIGVVQELPFAATLYRRWPAWLFYAVNGVVGVLYAFPAQSLLSVEATDAVRLSFFPIAGASALLFTWFARMIAKRLDRTGVTRGLRPKKESMPAAA